MITRALVTSLFLTTAVATAALAAPMELPVDKRIKLLEYNESDIYTIPTKYGFQTSIVFSADEEIQTISVGDRSPWQLIPSGSRLFIRPMMEDVTTNMTILTNKHSYQFDLKSSSSKDSSVVYVAKFVYPEEKPRMPAMPMTPPPMVVAPAPAPVMAAPVPAPKPTVAVYVPPSAPAAAAPAPRPMVKPPIHTGPTTPQNPNYNYTFSGPDGLEPLQVYDDGKATYIRYRDINQPVPNTFVIEKEVESPVPHRIQDGKLVIDMVAGELVLKNSNGTIHIYNETLNPAR